MIDYAAILGLSLPGWQIIAAALLATVCVGFATWAIMARRDPTEDQIQRRLDGFTGGVGSRAQAKRTVDDLFRSQGGSLASKIAVLGKPLEGRATYDRNQLSSQLARAGIRHENAVGVFLGAKMVLPIVGAGCGLLYGWSDELVGLNLFAAIMLGAVIGFFIPNGWLQRTMRRRSERIMMGLPDSLDMLVVAVEAGLGLDSAIQRVGDEMRRAYPELAEEWIIAARENQMGIPRSECMRKMADRTGIADMHSLVAILTQAERLGTSIAQTLRVHAETMRIKRRQRAEEQAAKTTVKLLFPLVFFIFPSIFVVVLGPAVINFIESGIFK